MGKWPALRRLHHFLLSWLVACMEEENGRGHGKTYCQRNRLNM